jgi:hypothetical protein
MSFVSHKHKSHHKAKKDSDVVVPVELKELSGDAKELDKERAEAKAKDDADNECNVAKINAAEKAARE